MTATLTFAQNPNYLFSNDSDTVTSDIIENKHLNMESHLKNMHHTFKVIVMFAYSFTGKLEKWSTNSKLCILVNVAALTIWTEWLMLPVSCLFLVFQLLYESFKVWVTDLRKMFRF